MIFILGLAASLCFVVTIGMCVIRSYLKQQGEYQTNEAKDARRYDNADAAVLMAKNGQPPVQDKKEYFM